MATKKQKTPKSSSATKTHHHRPTRESAEKKKRWWAKEFVLPVTLAIIGSGGLIAVLLSSLPAILVALNLAATPTPASTAHRPERIAIQDACYHIGDVEFVTQYQNGQITQILFCHPAPQNNPFSAEFDLPYAPNIANIHIAARSIDPDEKRSPIKVFINGIFVDLLNRYYTSETMDEKEATISIKPSLLREGKNNMQLFVESSNLDVFPNVDDIEFRNLYLEVIP